MLSSNHASDVARRARSLDHRAAQTSSTGAQQFRKQSVNSAGASLSAPAPAPAPAPANRARGKSPSAKIDNSSGMRGRKKPRSSSSRPKRTDVAPSAPDTQSMPAATAAMEPSSPSQLGTVSPLSHASTIPGHAAPRQQAVQSPAYPVYSTPGYMSSPTSPYAMAPSAHALQQQLYQPDQHQYPYPNAPDWPAAYPGVGQSGYLPPHSADHSSRLTWVPCMVPSPSSPTGFATVMQPMVMPFLPFSVLPGSSAGSKYSLAPSAHHHNASSFDQQDLYADNISTVGSSTTRQGSSDRRASTMVISRSSSLGESAGLGASGSNGSLHKWGPQQQHSPWMGQQQHHPLSRSPHGLSPSHMSPSDAAVLRQAQARAKFTGALPPLSGERHARGGHYHQQHDWSQQGDGHAHGEDDVDSPRHVHSYYSRREAGGGGARSRKAKTEVTTSSLLRHPAFSTRYFILKANDIEIIQEAMRTGRWLTQEHNNPTLDQAFRCSETVVLIFGANHTGQFAGYARMASAIYDKSAPSGGAAKAAALEAEENGQEQEGDEEEGSVDVHSSVLSVQVTGEQDEENILRPYQPTKDALATLQQQSTLRLPKNGHGYVAYSAVMSRPVHDFVRSAATDGGAPRFSAAEHVLRARNGDMAGEDAAGNDALTSSAGGDAFEGMDLQAFDTWSLEAKIRNLSIDELEARQEKEKLIKTLKARYGDDASELVTSTNDAGKGDASAKPSAEGINGSAITSSAPEQDREASESVAEKRGKTRSNGKAKAEAKSQAQSSEKIQPEASAEEQEKDLSFAIEWILKRPVPFHAIRNLRNPWRDDRQIKVSRDGTELEPSVGAELLQIWNKLPADGCGSCGRAKPRLLENED